MNAQLHTRFQNFRDQDATLIQAAKAGVKDAAVFLLRRHASRFRNIVRRVLAVNLRSILDPEDILQEIAVVLLTKSLPDWLCTPADFTRFVGAIARNIARAHNRRHLNGRHHSRNHEVPVASVAEVDTPPSAQPDPIDLAEDKETLADVQDWLPLRVREIVMWVCLGYSVAEVASRFDIDEETVVMFVCTANNHGPHPERRIDKEEAMLLFKPRRGPRRDKSAAQ